MQIVVNPKRIPKIKSIKKHSEFKNHPRWILQSGESFEEEFLFIRVNQSVWAAARQRRVSAVLTIGSCHSFCWKWNFCWGYRKFFNFDNIHILIHKIFYIRRRCLLVPYLSFILVKVKSKNLKAFLTTMIKLSLCCVSPPSIKHGLVGAFLECCKYQCTLMSKLVPTPAAGGRTEWWS